MSDSNPESSELIRAREIDAVIDRAKIHENAVRYVQSVDRLDYELMMSTYWPDSTDDHGNFQGTGPEWCEFVCGMRSNLVRTHHIVGNFLADIDGPRAKVELYFRGIAIFKSEVEGTPDGELHTAGRYKDLYERRGSEWKILRRTVTWDWSRPVTADPDWSWLREGEGQFGDWAPDDPIYQEW
ncbi:nuclear transport factor 2 family protein [Aeromicrobium sp. Leaf350]|uniref:nuclear transport factor 2 family protein n=1 Tax=Aeromicrobium sp. Leaf350 TaxID=2876565 RepID=UPI001E567490|nr:nuclear transport factor 2 family protein [Aeromicrobium sp. Leaf350]